jgi:hypothetical protein
MSRRLWENSKSWGLFTLFFYCSIFTNTETLTETDKVSQRVDFLVLEKVALTHVKQQQCILLELSNAFDCLSQKENILLNTENKIIIVVLTWLGNRRRIVVGDQVSSQRPEDFLNMFTQVPHCDGHNCNHLWLRFVTVKSGHNAALESFKSLILSSSFWDFLWRPAFILQNPSHCAGHKCDHLWRFCDSLKAVTMKTGKESFNCPSLSGFLCRLQTVTMRLVLESFKSLALAGYF